MLHGDFGVSKLNFCRKPLLEGTPENGPAPCYSIVARLAAGWAPLLVCRSNYEVTRRTGEESIYHYWCIPIMQVLAVRLPAELISASGTEAYAEPLERLGSVCYWPSDSVPPRGEPEADEGVRNMSSLRYAGLSRTYLCFDGRKGMNLIIHVSSSGAENDYLEMVH